ncbi:restriction endonuclease subunit S [Hydrogenophaga sp.]|uniref:restriction endonuclease subunit S n=1 Tax=Hydrogenophaga sp. TaxID=1904254 RepID=UPI002FC9AFA3
MRDWTTRALSELADIRISNVDKKSVAGEKPVRLCNYMDAYSNDYIRSDIEFMEATASASEIARFSVTAGDVVLTKDSETPDDIGIPAVIMDQFDDVVCGYHLALLKTKQELVDPVFLCKQLGTSRAAQYFGQRATGSTRYGLPNRALATFQIPVPPLAVQRTIARVLQTIDTAIEKTEALIAKHQQIKAGLMHDLFTRGALPNGQLRPPRSEAPELYQETALGWIPRDWQVVALHECLSSSPKNGYSPRESDTWEGFYVLGLGCLTKDGFEARQLKNAPKAAATLREAQLEVGDLLISRANTPELVGLCGVFPGLDSPTIYPDLMMRLSLRQTMDKHFLEAQLLLPETRSRLTALAVGTSSSMAKLNATSINKFPVLLPSVEEQRLILNRSLVVVEVIRSAKAALEKLTRQKLGLMQDLLTGRVPVPAPPEPAEAVA